VRILDLKNETADDTTPNLLHTLIPFSFKKEKIRWRHITHMSEKNDFFDDIIGDEPEASEFELMADEMDEDEPLDMRTVVMAKEEMIALLGLKTSPKGGLIIRVDPRENQPSAQTYDDPAAASKWFNRSLSSSRRNGWQVIYDGEPLFG
jgi:hypothetical protein